MNKEVAYEWADALESGNFKQCFGKTSRINPETGEAEHCPLGVLRTLREEWLDLGTIHLASKVEFSGWPALQVGDSEYRTPITYLNDISKWELKRFADYIREQWEQI